MKLKELRELKKLKDKVQFDTKFRDGHIDMAATTTEEIREVIKQSRIDKK